MQTFALVTGASGGIGCELAKVLAENGHNLIITARRTGQLQQLKQELESEYPVTVHTFPADLSLSDTPAKIYNFISDHDIQVDILINNAGIGDYGFFHQSNWGKQATMIDLNIKSLTHLTHLFLPTMIDRNHGYILNLASTAAFQPGPLMSVYYASKHYVLAFSEAISNELKDTGVSVTVLCPGPTNTGFQETAAMEKSRLLDWFRPVESRKIAEFGYDQMIKGKRVAVQGMSDKIFSVLVRFFPRSLVLHAVRFIQQRN